MDPKDKRITDLERKVEELRKRLDDIEKRLTQVGREAHEASIWTRRY